MRRIKNLKKLKNGRTYWVILPGSNRMVAYIGPAKYMVDEIWSWLQFPVEIWKNVDGDFEEEYRKQLISYDYTPGLEIYELD